MNWNAVVRVCNIMIFVGKSSFGSAAAAAAFHSFFLRRGGHVAQAPLLSSRLLPRARGEASESRVPKRCKPKTETELALVAIYYNHYSRERLVRRVSSSSIQIIHKAEPSSTLN